MNSNSTSLSEEGIISSVSQDFNDLNPKFSVVSPQQQQKTKKKRNLPGNPDPNADVIALSPKSLMATNRFVCEVCNKGFKRDQNLQLHRRGHNLPWKLKQSNSKEIKKKVYVCPESSCIHHHPSRALGDLTGIRKHFCRKHGEKNWKCEKCSKKYAVRADWRAHSKICGTREYKCDCGTLFFRKDRFTNHRAFCNALAEVSARTFTNPTDQLPLHLPPQNQSPLFPSSTSILQQQHLHHFPNPQAHHFSVTSWERLQNPNPIQNPVQIKVETHYPHHHHISTTISPSQFLPPPTRNTPNSAHMSASALLQKATLVGAAAAAIPGAIGSQSASSVSRLGMEEFGQPPKYLGFRSGNFARWRKSNRLTRDDSMGLAVVCGEGGDVNVRDHLLKFTGGVEFPVTDQEALAR